jgi:hypothetical protein
MTLRRAEKSREPAKKISTPDESFRPVRSSSLSAAPHSGAPSSMELPMQRVTFVRYAAKPGRAEENERLSRAVFDELWAKRPAGVAYALCRDGDDFLHVFINFGDDSSDAVTELASFKAFGASASDRQVAPPEVVRLSTNVVESYGFEAAKVPA